jgi:MFS family permease
MGKENSVLLRRGFLFSGSGKGGLTMYRDRSLIGLNLAGFLMMLGVGMIVALLPQRIIDITGSAASVGYLAAAFAFSFIMFQLPLGNLADKRGFKFFIVLGYLLCSVTGLLYYFSDSARYIFLGRFIQGMGEVPIWALVPALLSVKYPLSKGKVMGVYNGVFHLGLTAGPILGVLLAKIWPGNQAFLFYSLVSLLGAVVILVAVDNVSTGESKKVTMDFIKMIWLLSNKQILITLAGITLYGAGYGIFLTVLPAFLMGYKGFDAVQIGLFFSFFYMAISLSQIITGPLSDKLGRKMFMVAGLFMASTGFFTFLYAGQSLAVSMILTLASLGLGVFYLSSMAFLNDNTHDSLKGTISGAYYLFWGAGMFCGPIAMGKLISVSAKAGFIAYAVLLVIEALIMMIYRTPNTPGPWRYNRL